MHNKGTLYPEERLGIPLILKNRMRKLKPLEASLLEDTTKKVFKQTIWEEKGKGSLSILFLEPEAAIVRHEHTTDCEFYISWSTCRGFLKIEFCDKGESHELKNTSKRRWLWVLSVKFDRADET